MIINTSVTGPDAQMGREGLISAGDNAPYGSWMSPRSSNSIAIIILLCGRCETRFHNSPN